MSRIEIRGEQHAISDVFSNKFAFFVPPYQRPYSWTTEHAGELLDDLLAFLGDGNEPIDDLNPYFLGSIVLIKGDRPEAQTVDGQQRLLTLTILLSALRALVSSEYAQDITSVLYEQENRLRNLPARYRVRPKERDVDFFQTYIQHKGGIAKLRSVNASTLSDSQRNMRENALLYLENLQGLPEQQRIRLAEFVLQRCLLVVVSTPDLDSAYRIFSVLNDRGLDLSHADILKAEVIGRVPQDLQKAYTDKWDDIEEELGREDFESLLSHIRTLYRKRWRRDTVLKEFRQHVISAVGDSQHLIDDILQPLSEAYRIIKDEDYQSENVQQTKVVNTCLRWLNRIPDTDWIPPALLYLSRYANEPDRLARFFTDLERLAAGLLIRRSPVSKRFERYNYLMRAIEDNALLGAPDSPLQLTVDDRKLIFNLLNGDFYLNYSRTRHYVLLRLDALLSGGDATYAYKTISVEHVLPQRPAPNSVWLQWFPTRELHDQWLHRLGNLALLSRAKNAQASNYDFDQKKRTYFATRDGVSPFALTTQVVGEKEWTPEVVERRQRDLLQRLREIWRL